MRGSLITIMCATLVFSLSSLCSAAPKPDLPAMMTAAKGSIEETAAKVGNYPQALAEIEKARISLKKAEQAYDKGKQWMGLLSMKPEAEQEVLHHLTMTDAATALAVSRATKGRHDEEAAAVDKQIATVKARVKLLEERQAETDRLKQLVQKCETAGKEAATQKSELGKLTAQVEQLTADKKKLEGQVTSLTTEKAALADQLEALKKQPAAAK